MPVWFHYAVNRVIYLELWKIVRMIDEVDGVLQNILAGYMSNKILVRSATSLSGRFLWQPGNMEEA